MALAAPPPTLPCVQQGAHALLEDSLKAVLKAKGAGAPATDIGHESLCVALAAVIAEAVGPFGLTDDQADGALAATLGWLMVAGPEQMPPHGGDGVRRIEHFIRRALLAAEGVHEAQQGPPLARSAA